MVRPMKAWNVWLMVMIVALAGLSGCFGKKKDDGGTSPVTPESEPDPSTLTTEDSALGNQGYLVKGGFSGEAVALKKENSAVQLDIVSVVDNDADTSPSSFDRANFVLVAEAPDLKVEAKLKTLVPGSAAGSSGDFGGGASTMIPVFGTTGRVTSQLPEAKAFLFAAGEAAITVNGVQQPGTHLVFAMVTEGFRDDASQAFQQTPDATDLEFHVFFPGDLVEGRTAVPSTPESSLYFYFELVGPSMMTEEQKAKVGEGMKPPELPNQPPQPVARFLVAGNAVTEGTREGNGNLTVTLDASLSSDPDGTIEVFVWKVAEPNATGVLPEPGDPAIKVVSGQKADFNFSKSGPKTIELVVRDNKGKVVSIISTFYVNYHALLPFRSTVTQPLGVFNECQDALNCNKHDIPFQFGFENGTMTFRNAGTVAPNDVTIQIHPPGNTDPGADELKRSNDAPLDVDKTIINQTGTYRVYVWWMAGVNVSYNLEVYQNYAPRLSEPAGEALDSIFSAPLLGREYASTNRN